MRTFILGLTISIVFGNQVFGQEQDVLYNHNSLGGQFSFLFETLHFQNIETILNGKRNNGIGFNIQPQWQYKNLEESHSVNLSIGIAFASTSVKGDEGSYFPNLKLQYEYEHKISETNYGIWSIGMFAKADYRLAIYPTWDESHGYWADFMGVGFLSTFEKPMHGSKFIFTSLQLPIIGFNSRPEAIRNYKMDDPSIGGILKIVNKNFKFVTLIC